MTVAAPLAEYPVGAFLGPIRLEVTAGMAARFAQVAEQVMLVALGDAYRGNDALGGTVQHRLAVGYRRPAAASRSMS